MSRGLFREDIFTSAINLSQYESVDHAIQLYDKVLTCIIDKHAPIVNKRVSTKKSAFWNETCQEAVRERRRAKRKHNKDRNNEEFKTAFYEKATDAEIIINNANYNKTFSQ